MGKLHCLPINMEDALPADLSYIDTYQQAAWHSIVWDSDTQKSATINGLPLRQYMRNGIHEELQEITAVDTIEPAYDRRCALALYQTTQSEYETETAVNSHIYEFGDVSWYITNFMSSFHLPLHNSLVSARQNWPTETVVATIENCTHELQME